MATQYQHMVLPQSNYMTLDNNTLNHYNYKNFSENFDNYKQYQDQYYFTRQINPISLANSSPESRDPSNRPCDVRTNIYFQADANNNDPLIKFRHGLDNNPNNWRDLIVGKQGYHNQNESTLNYIRPISSIQAGHASSIVDYQGYYYL